MIELAPGLQLPDSAVTNSYALLAMKGAGKSNAAVVFAEQLYAASIPWVCIDPKGDWWGIRSGAAGKGKGLPVPIFGGVHADVPIDPQAGRLFADLIVEQHLTALIDTSELTKGESIRFLTAFFEQLYRRKNRATYPMHLFLEEADDYVPQKVYGDVAALVRTVELVVKRGRQRGLGITLASQRAASVNKDALTQTDTLIVLRTTSPQDRKAIKEWLDYNAGAQGIVDELPELRDGEAWVSSPAQLRILKRVTFRRRSTFDSGATPELGEKVKPATLADIDVAAITAAVGDLVEKAKADDPKALRAEVARLKRVVEQIDRARAPEPEIRTERVEVPVVPEAVTLAIAGTIAVLDQALVELAAHRAAVARALDKAEKAKAAAPRPAAPPPRARPTTTPPVARIEADPSSNGTLGRRERKILTVLAQHRLPDGPVKQRQRKLALLTGYSAKASTVGAGLSELRKAGYVDGWTITEPGRAALGQPDALPTGPDLLGYWYGELGERERRLLAELVAEYPSALTQAEMAERTPYSATASTIGAGMSTLRGLGIAEGWRLSDEFAEAIA